MDVNKSSIFVHVLVCTPKEAKIVLFLFKVFIDET